MPIPTELRNVVFEYECPICRHPIVRTGSWFKSVSKFVCDECGAKLWLTYSDKLAIFERYKHVERSRSPRRDA
ncbi:hypothetical protein FJ546_09980 [Mesorhizobium sp. B2-4-19]|nr:hypothetical protein FJ546_09980 [Mesorhizobium sp. B2-4-19]